MAQSAVLHWLRSATTCARPKGPCSSVAKELPPRRPGWTPWTFKPIIYLSIVFYLKTQNPSPTSTMNQIPGPFAGEAGTSNYLTYEHSLQEWEEQRGRFTHLYIEEDRTLSEARSIMESQYGFYATERQYKRKITAWKLDKNIKDGDMKVMLRKQLKRKLDGKESEFYLRGRPVTPQKMSRFAQRKGMTMDDILEEHMPTPSHITCHTPNGSVDEEDSGDRVEDIIHQAPLAFDTMDLGTPVRSSLPHSGQASDLVGKLDPSQLAKDGATNIAGQLSNLSFSESMTSSPHPLPSFRSLILSIEPGVKSPLTDDMAQFAARMSWFMWFNNWTIIGFALTKNETPATPWTSTQASLYFLNWTKTVLSTTQISGNTIQLALLYIYRLRKANPAVRGKPGSEYRLLTIALMLSNKFLDDHVYTNRTWAEVCGISVEEIRVMEVEFISSMKYDLLATKEQWIDWRSKMDEIYQYLKTEQRVSTGLPSWLLVKENIPSLNSFENGAVTFLARHPTRESKKPARFRVQAPNTARRLEYVSAGSPIIRCVSDAAGSPFERCSPRYHLSTSPEYYRRDITSTNPLSFLSPFPIRSSSVHSTPVLTSSLDTTAHALKPHEVHYRNIESSKESIQSGRVQNGLPSIQELGLDWPALTDEDAIGA